MAELPQADSIDASVVADFFRARGVNPRCSFCSNKELSVSQVSFSVSFRVGMRLGTYVNMYSLHSQYSADASLMLFALTCNKCGHTMTFDLSVILDWLKTMRTNTIQGDDNGQ